MTSSKKVAVFQRKGARSRVSHVKDGVDIPGGHPKKKKAHEVEGTPLNRAGRRRKARDK